jgi:hypothetical protein
MDRHKLINLSYESVAANDLWHTGVKSVNITVNNRAYRFLKAGTLNFKIPE